MAAITTKIWTSPSDSQLVDRGLKVEVTGAVGMPEEIFMWRRVPDGPTAKSTGDQFVGVATPSDLEDVPANTPDILNEMPYYRTKDVELWFRNDADFSKYREMLQRHINDLVTKLNKLATLTPEAEVTFPPAAADPEASTFYCPRCPFATKDFTRICPTCPFVEAVRAAQAGS